MLDPASASPRPRTRSGSDRTSSSENSSLNDLSFPKAHLRKRSTPLQKRTDLAASGPDGSGGTHTLYGRILQPSQSHPPTALERLLREAVTTRTWQARQRTIRLFESLGAKASPLAKLDNFLDVRLAAVTPATLIKDISHLKWYFTRKYPRAGLLEVLEDVSRALRVRDATRPKRKALPLSSAQMRLLLKGLRGLAALAALLAWRSASRLSDLLNIYVAHAGEDGLMVRFTQTKANKEGDTRADHLLFVEEAGPLMRLAGRSNPFSQAHLQQVRKALRALEVPESELITWQRMSTATLRTRYTGHSLKRGAAAELWRAAAEGVLSPQHVQHVLKHKDLQSSVGYAQNHMHVAMALSKGSTLPTRL